MTGPAPTPLPVPTHGLVPVLVLGPDGDLRDADETLCRMVGRDGADLLGRPLASMCVGADDDEACAALVAQVRDAAPRGQADLTWRGPSGADLPVRLVWAVTRHDRRGRPVEVTAFCLPRAGEDAEQERRLLASRFHSRFHLSGVPQAMCDVDGLLTHVNPAYCRLLDRSEAELVGSPVRELNHRSDPGAGDDALAALLRGEVESTQVERTVRRADGRPVPVLVHANRLFDAGGRPIGAAAFVQDLTELRDIEQHRQQQQGFFLALSQRASDLAIVVDAEEGRILYASPALASVLGYDDVDVLMAEVTDFVHPDDLGDLVATFVRMLRSGESVTSELRVRDATGAWRWIEQTATNLVDTAVGGIVCNLRDISQRVRAEAALRASESRYRAIADNADEGLWVVSPDGRTVYVNSRLVEILGLPEEHVLGRGTADVLGIDEAALPAPDGSRAVRTPVTYRHPDGEPRVLSIARAFLDDAEGAVEGSLAMVSDVTEARRLEHDLRTAARRDALTGLPNRELLLERLALALERETRGTAVLFLDLDRFKVVNDARGHAVGDELLEGVGTRLRSAVRPTDTLARFGGDEFLVVCEDVEVEGARRVAEALLASLEEPVRAAGGEAHLSASIGVALSPAPSAEALLRHADTAMYAAKTAGRGRIRIFDATLAAHAEERFVLGGDLRRALAEDALTLAYQPIVDLSSGRVLGAEALSRWQHPTRGPVPPDRFVGVAEETGLAGRLDRWAVRRAAYDAADLRASGSLAADAYVSVNVSARTLGDPGLEDWILRHVEAAGLAPDRVVLEVTESAIMLDATSSVALLTRFRRRGFGIAVDDFGTGHSSLAYLRHLPLTLLKIDRSFVAEITTDPSARAIAASIVDLARAIGVSVVAEGVETLEHADLLRDLGCDAAQGWLWCPAVPKADARSSHALVRAYDVR